MKKTIINIASQAARPSRFLVMLKKLGKRILEKEDQRDKDQNLKWLRSESRDLKKFAISLDAEIWEESEKASRLLETHAKKILENIEYDLGGGGAHPLLYFITRYMEPSVVVETGVAAGFSSSSFLTAIKANGRGRLYSSDFPYFRIPNPEQYVGIVVEETLRDGWELLIDGDETNLPRIVNSADEIDIFHYDSDKSYSGRKFAISTIASSLSNRSVILMDDIQDNSFFFDYVQEMKPESWFVFEFENKYVGMVGKPTRRCEEPPLDLAPRNGPH